jgi:hypothetical protein
MLKVTPISYFARRQSGLGLIGWLLMIPMVFAVLLALAVGFYEGRKAYWDHKVRELCEKDGGVMVYERTTIDVKQAKELPKIEGSISIPPRVLAKLTTPLVSADIEGVIREQGPRVVRREKRVIRRSDGKEVGRMVSYSRIGGDFPTGFREGTSFVCPEYKKLYAEQARFFVIEGAR